jgi:16S rRNA (cytidine1402-2'-O)-methyltransferase
MHKAVLYVVATPIGNMSDLTFRAREVLQQVDCIAVEDSRQSGKLLKYYEIRTPMMTLFEHNEQRAIPKVLSRLEQGQSVALISDAGTPLVSDPGYALVQAVHAANYPVLSVPGASSVMAALSVSGLPLNRFTFEGFLPSKSHARRQCLQALAKEQRTLVVFEAPHRIQQLLSDCRNILGAERRAVVARELTKIHESLHRGNFTELAELFLQTSLCRGEMVVIIEGYQVDDEPKENQQAVALAQILNKELPVKKAVALAAQFTGANRNALYQQMIKLKNES